jgi:TolB-like protein/cytochrome c-type biogenesis protein CcmH/NrfG
MSGDKEQEYFSDGLTEELLNSLAEINELQVAARTSAFSFKGKDTDIGTIARKLNVASVLEGSVRRSGNTVRVTTQLINAVTGFHLWSHTYDRDLGDVLKLETEIADAVASALKVSLLGDVATKIELGGTRNPAAFDAYLRGRKAHLAAHGDKDYQTAITAYTEAIGLDQNYALAFANRSLALRDYANEVSGPVVRESLEKAQADARKAFALAPDLAEGHLALASYFETGLLDYTRANEEYQRALALAPGNAGVVRGYGRFAAFMGRTEVAIATLRRAVALDPLSRESHAGLGAALYWARQNNEAIAGYRDALALDPENPRVNALLGAAYYALGDFRSARASCERNADYWESQWCLAVTYDKLGRHADAEAQLAKLKAAQGDDVAYQYAEIYAQWGDTPKALQWLETALRVRDAGLVQIKVDPQIDTLRKEPRFQAVMWELKFPTD